MTDRVNYLNSNDSFIRLKIKNRRRLKLRSNEYNDIVDTSELEISFRKNTEKWIPNRFENKLGPVG